MNSVLYEVEQKFRVADLAVVEQQLARRGARFAAPVTQRDCYFRHPSRNLAATDEAFRLRCVGERSFLTYKGPKVDDLTKTRREIEFPLADGADNARLCEQLLAALGFSPAGEVVKTRRTATIDFRGAEIVAALDQVQGLGDFLELEMSSGDEGLNAARMLVRTLAEELGVDQNERRSYLELLLSQQQDG